MMKSIRRHALRVAAATVASGILAAGAVALAGSASASTLSHASTTSYSFQTLDNARDLTFNQLLGVNDEGLIAGYFGSGAQGHPNQGYLLAPRAGAYVNENFPDSVQTQVTGLNNEGVTVGFWSDANGNNHGYEYNIRSGRFSTVTYQDASLTAAAINDRGDVAGFYTNPGTTDAFIKFGNRTFISLAVPGASSTMALGVNNSDEVVGTYTVGSGSSAVMHGFTWTPQHGFSTIDDPHGIGTTTINGVNDHGQLVGFYVDANGNTDGFLAAPQR